MPKGKPVIAKEVKEQILKRIKDNGLPVSQVAEEHGISSKTIYNWLGKGVTAGPSVLEMAKLRRENQTLKELIGEITLEMNQTKKKEVRG